MAFQLPNFGDSQQHFVELQDQWGIGLAHDLQIERVHRLAIVQIRLAHGGCVGLVDICNILLQRKMIAGPAYHQGACGLRENKRHCLPCRYSINRDVNGLIVIRIGAGRAVLRCDGVGIEDNQVKTQGIGNRAGCVNGCGIGRGIGCGIGRGIGCGIHEDIS